MVKSKNPSGKVHAKARAEAAVTASKASNPEDPTMPVFFYMPNEVPYGIFCQWQRSWFSVPKSSFSYLNRDAEVSRAPKPKPTVGLTKGELTSKMVTTTIAASSTTKAAPPNSGPQKQNEERITFNCAEQYMMYSKAVYFTDPDSGTKILASRDPKEQKAIGRRVKGYNDHEWKGIRAKVGEEGNYAKFTQDERLKGLLLGTGERLLCEAAKRDAIWGIGMDASDGIAIWNAFGQEAQERWGENLLGKAIMAARMRIKEEESHQSGSENVKEEETVQDKKRRGLKKKLRDIEALKKRRAEGETLEDTQIRKIGSEQGVRKELETLGEKGEETLAEPLW